MDKNALIDKVVEEFERRDFDRLSKMQRVVMSVLERRLSQEGIPCKVAGRVKTANSLRKKLQNWASHEHASKRDRLSGTVDEITSSISDLLGVRVMTYTERDREAVVKLVKQEFVSPPGFDNFDEDIKERDDPRIKANTKNHYRATHMMIALNKEQIELYSNLARDKCELQITSMLAHVWNELEHDMQYKSLSGELSIEEIEGIDSLGLLTKTGDKVIESLLKRQNSRKELERINSEQISDPGELEELLLKYYGTNDFFRNRNYSEGTNLLFDLLKALSLLHPKEIVFLFSPATLKESQKQLKKFKKFIERKEIANVSLQMNTCDVFSMALMQAKEEELREALSDKHGNHKALRAFKAFLDFR